MVPMPERDEGVPVRVMTWNVQRLATIAGAESPACVADTVAGAGPDVVVLQEVSARELAPLERLGDLVCTQSTYFGSTKAWRAGVAVCVRGASFALGRAWPVRYDEASRWHYLVQEVVVTREGVARTFNVANVHLRPYLGTREALGQGPVALARGFVRDAAAQSVQAREVLEQVRAFRDPTVAAGDFNSVRDAPLHARMRRSMRDAWEIAGRGPGFTAWRGPRDVLPFRIDYVYATPDFGVADARVRDVACSDHRPVVADLVLRR
jgi:endonuclease/exonuclease/phosphatase family metal-dependent hydrolase